MQELFRFYTVRSPDLAGTAGAVDLTTPSKFQADMGKALTDPKVLTEEAQRVIIINLAEVTKDHQAISAGLTAFRGRLPGLSQSDKTTLADAIRADFKSTLSELQIGNNAILTRLKDLLAAYRTVKALAARLALPGLDTSKGPAVADLMAELRFRSALASAKDTNTAFSLRATFVRPVMFPKLDWILQLKPIMPLKQSAAQVRAARLAELAQLAQLIGEVVAASPYQLEIRNGAAPACWVRNATVGSAPSPATRLPPTTRPRPRPPPRRTSRPRTSRI